MDISYSNSEEYRNSGTRNVRIRGRYDLSYPHVALLMGVCYTSYMKREVQTK
jgi:hypothetical protein|tara:strand:+ start:816 stop:971 length:156 start_codon:yes stop_codon:yes gene_type:complete